MMQMPFFVGNLGMKVFICTFIMCFSVLPGLTGADAPWHIKEHDLVVLYLPTGRPNEKTSIQPVLGHVQHLERITFISHAETPISRALGGSNIQHINTLTLKRYAQNCCLDL